MSPWTPSLEQNCATSLGLLFVKLSPKPVQPKRNWIVQRRWACYYKKKKQLETLRKTQSNISKNIGFDITISVGINMCNFLDLTLDLYNNLYMPYRKENSCIKSINNKSGTPLSSKGMIENRLTQLLKDESIFKNAVPIYQAALHRSSFKHSLNYTNTPKPNTKRNRKRNTIYFNPPFCQSIKNNIGKKP